METEIQLDNGERLVAGAQTDAGVLTDAGIIPWPQIAGFWCYRKDSSRWMFVPTA